jgi:nitrogen fixation-related uncharacterized protein
MMLSIAAFLRSPTTKVVHIAGRGYGAAGRISDSMAWDSIACGAPARPQSSHAMTPAAVYIIAICAVGGVIACGAFVWAALKGEFTDASEAAFLVFDDEDAPAGPERTA